MGTGTKIRASLGEKDADIAQKGHFRMETNKTGRMFWKWW